MKKITSLFSALLLIITLSFAAGKDGNTLTIKGKSIDKAEKSFTYDIQVRNHGVWESQATGKSKNGKYKINISEDGVHRIIFAYDDKIKILFINGENTSKFNYTFNIDVDFGKERQYAVIDKTNYRYKHSIVQY